MSGTPNPYAGLPHAELCGLRKDFAKMLHAAVSARKVAERNLNLIGQAMADDEGSREFEASDHAVVRYLERVQGVDVNAIRDTITFNCANGVDLIGDKLRGADGFLYCLNDEGHITTILPLDAVVNEAAEHADRIAARPASGQRKRRLRAKREFIASCDTHPKGGDAPQSAAPSPMSGAVAATSGETPKDHSPQPIGEVGNDQE